MQVKKIFLEKLHKKIIGQWNPEGIKKYANNTGWALSVRTASILISFLVSIILIRSLGPSAYGELSYAISFVGLFSIISSLGIDSVLYRELIQYPNERATYLGTAFIIKLTSGAIATLITIISAFLLSPTDVSLVVIFILSGTFIFNAFNIIIFEFQANVEQKYPSIVSFSVICLLNVLKLLVIFSGGGVIYLAGVFLFEAIFYAIGYIYIRTRYYGSLLQWRYDGAVARRMLYDAWPFIFVALFTTVYARIDQIMLKYMVDSTAVGLYDAAVRIAEVWLFIPGIIASTLFPAIINAKKISISEYKKRILMLASLLGGIALIISLVSTLLAKPIISLLYGPAYTASILIFAVYVWSGIGASLSHVVSYFLIAEHKRKIIFFTSLSTMSLNIALNIVLIPAYGMIGAAWATLISYSLLALPIVLVFHIKVLK